jgi:hypothetical protein
MSERPAGAPQREYGVISHFRATSPFSRAILFLPTAMLTEYEQQRERNVRSCRF